MQALRAAEWINLLYFCFLGGLAFLVPMRGSRRFAVLLIGALGTGLVAVAPILIRFITPLAASVVRDWLPALLLLAAYHQGGQFFTRPMEPLQNALFRVDQRLFAFLRRSLGMDEMPRLARAYFEIAYIFCYPLVPMGVGVLYLAHMGRYSDEFWAIVLPPSYLCYAMIPFLPTLPPWQVGAQRAAMGAEKGLRGANFLIIRHLSIKTNTFPSAHVAASVATALALLHLVPLVGLVFLWMAVSIAIGTVSGRYHYTLDAVMGAAVAVATFALRGFL